MGRTSIPVDRDTKERLDAMKREDETWDEFLTRMTEGDEPMTFGTWSEETAEKAMERLREGRERPE